MLKRRTILSYENALSRAAALCSKCEQCTPDIRKKLVSWGVDNADIAKIINRLIELKFVDDIRFSKAYAHDKLHFSGWGRKKIKMGLWAKRLPNSIIDNACADFDEDEYLGIAMNVLRAKARAMKEWPLSRESKIKLIRHAMQRGFEYSLIVELMRSDRLNPHGDEQYIV